MRRTACTVALPTESLRSLIFEVDVVACLRLGSGELPAGGGSGGLLGVQFQLSLHQNSAARTNKVKITKRSQDEDHAKKVGIGNSAVRIL